MFTVKTQFMNPDTNTALIQIRMWVRARSHQCKMLPSCTSGQNFTHKFSKLTNSQTDDKILTTVTERPTDKVTGRLHFTPPADRSWRLLACQAAVCHQAACQTLAQTHRDKCI